MDQNCKNQRGFWILISMEILAACKDLPQAKARCKHCPRILWKTSFLIQCWKTDRLWAACAFTKALTARCIVNEGCLSLWFPSMQMGERQGAAHPCSWCEVAAWNCGRIRQSCHQSVVNLYTSYLRFFLFWSLNITCYSGDKITKLDSIWL